MGYHLLCNSFTTEIQGPPRSWLPAVGSVDSRDWASKWNPHGCRTEGRVILAKIATEYVNGPPEQGMIKAIYNLWRSTFFVKLVTEMLQVKVRYAGRSRKNFSCLSRTLFAQFLWYTYQLKSKKVFLGSGIASFTNLHPLQRNFRQQANVKRLRMQMAYEILEGRISWV